MATVEECLRLSAFRLSRYGRLRLEGGGRAVGIYATSGKVAIASEGRAYSVRRVRLKTSRGCVYWLVCPLCRRKTWVLFSPGRQQGFFCRRCLGLTYAAWKRNGYRRWPKSPGPWLAQFVRRAGRVLNDGRI